MPRAYILNEDKARGLGYEYYTADLLKQFQVVLFSGLPEKTSDTAASDDVVAAFRARLDAYSRAGGGIIWVPMSFGHWGTYWNKLVGARYDAQSLEEDLYDPPKTIDLNPAYRNPLYRYIWTTNVAKHPVTEGVRGLLLPVLGEWSWPGTVPMKFGASWTPLVRGMDSTATVGNAAPVGSGQHKFGPEVKGSYAGAPEIVGVRERVNGFGRMMVFPFHSTHTYLNFNHFVFNDAMMLRGDGTHPSDGLRLLLNGMKWLAEPAATAGLGGYQPPKPNTRPALTPIDWAKAAFAGNSWSGMGSWWDDVKQRDVPMPELLTVNARDYTGIVGARTEASDGQGTVADYVTAAKKLGLSFIIFLENLEKCDDARYAKLVADCKAQSNETFAAIPGYLYRDLGNNLHFAYSTSKLPLPANLTPERRVLAPNDIVEQNGWANGQGIAELGKLKLDMAYLFLFTAAAPYVYDEGKLTDEGVANYCYSEGLGHMYAPLSLTMVRSPQALAATVATAHLTVVHAEKLDALKEYLGRGGQHPHPVYLTNGPTITRWGALNPLGHPYWPGKDRVRVALSAESAVGIREVKILDSLTGTLYRAFHPNGAKSFTCTVDESHKQQWVLVPIVTDMQGRTAIAAGLQTYQDGNRLWLMGDRLMGMHHSMGWDEKHQKLMKMSGWLGHTWTKPYEETGSYPPNPREVELKIQGMDGGAVHPAAIDIEPAVVTDLGTEPQVKAYRFQNTLASFDYAVMDYRGDAQFLVNKRTKQKSAWWETPDAQVPTTIADIHERVWAVRPRYLASLAANVHEITVTFKRDAKLNRVRLFGMRTGGEAVNVFIMQRDSEGEFSWLVAPGESFSRQGVLQTGGYLYPANYRGGAPGVVNLGPQPIDYDCRGMSSQVYVNGNGRQVKAGEKITVRFLTFLRPWQGQLNNQWLKQYIADFGIGGKPGYQYALTQGKVRGVNYALDLNAVNGGATLTVQKYDLPHNLVTRVYGLSNNAIVGRYDLTSKQLLILPVLEGMAPTSIDTNRGDTNLYIGELFHCSDAAVRISAVQDGADTLLLELHNPTDAPKTVKVTAVPGFTPLAGLKDTITLAPCSSVKRTLRTPVGTLPFTPYTGD